MGATFPVAADWFARRQDGKTAAADAGALYAWNTLGAAAGALAAGFWLIPAIGLRGSTWIGVALNVGVAGAAWLLAHSRPAAASATPDRISQTQTAHDSQACVGAQSVVGAPSLALASVATAISGFSALVYEVAWTRLLAVIFGPTTYAFSTMAAAFIGGLALGASAGGWLARRVRRPDIWLGLLLMVAAVIAPVSASIAATRLPLAVAALVVEPAQGFGGILARQALAAALLLLPMAIAIGATFPLAVAVAVGGATTVGRDVARVYAANTLGALAGALAAGFALIPLLGLRSTFQAMGMLGAVGGSICLARACVVNRSASPVRSGRTGWVAAGGIGIVVAVALVWLLPPWDRQLLAGGAYKYAPYLAQGEVDAALHAGTLEYYQEGAAAIVSVKRLTGIRSLSIDGKVDASTGSDMLTQRLLGLLPVLLHGRRGTDQHHRARQRRDRRLGAGGRHRPTRGRGRDLARSGDGFAVLRSRERARPHTAGSPADRRRRAVASSADARPLRRDHLRTIESLDVGGRGAVHPRVLRSRAGGPRARRRGLSMGAHI